ncbi:exo-alpha-sialidase [Trypanosoma cruzi]|nr:exo-alpha-sialidase [Trypanosoma cruzi]
MCSAELHPFLPHFTGIMYFPVMAATHGGHEGFSLPLKEIGISAIPSAKPSAGNPQFLPQPFEWMMAQTFVLSPFTATRGNTIAVPFATTPLPPIPQNPFHDFSRSWPSTTALERLPAPHVMRLPTSLESNNVTQKQAQAPTCVEFPT